MKNWKQVLVQKDATILDAIQIIDAGALKIALIVDDQQRLLGTLTDGDVRRGILRGVALKQPARSIMNNVPTTASEGSGREAIRELMRSKGLQHVPVVNENRQVVSLFVLDDLLEQQSCDNWVVLMAGGLGTRLMPLTETCPKPMLKVGGRPILETILNNFRDQGFSEIFISVNYLAESIIDYFGDGSRFGVNIRYLHEVERMGTAGALSLLPHCPNNPFIVMNGDLLTNVDFRSLIEFHIEHKAHGTMCVREYDFQVPYGVAKVEEHQLLGIEEKPVQRFFVNAGIYVLSPESLEIIPQGKFFDMPSAFDEMIKNNRKPAVFPLREYWLDLGRVDDFARAQADYDKVFR
ncbi:MAG: nucleotidyltransferase family protein [Desulfuromonadales bacterium]|nr:nucleotidyltransferase family protein [Desulfuromonadales bacterium]MDW7756468.1 nucleotidyltransferase family protein [Desulfuromonadales bacterium]